MAFLVLNIYKITYIRWGCRWYQICIISSIRYSHTCETPWAHSPKSRCSLTTWTSKGTVFSHGVEADDGGLSWLHRSARSSRWSRAAWRTQHPFWLCSSFQTDFTHLIPGACEASWSRCLSWWHWDGLTWFISHRKTPWYHTFI